MSRPALSLVKIRATRSFSGEAVPRSSTPPPAGSLPARLARLSVMGPPRGGRVSSRPGSPGPQFAVGK
jgi:hypothetical protein